MGIILISGTISFFLSSFWIASNLGYYPTYLSRLFLLLYLMVLMTTCLGLLFYASKKLFKENTHYRLFYSLILTLVGVPIINAILGRVGVKFVPFGLWHFLYLAILFSFIYGVSFLLLRKIKL